MVFYTREIYKALNLAPALATLEGKRRPSPHTVAHLPRQ
jgi:hypothetical protein